MSRQVDGFRHDIAQSHPERRAAPMFTESTERRGAGRPGFVTRVGLACATLALTATAGPAIGAGRVWPKGVDLPAGQPIDEAYRHEFAMCDTNGTFRGSTSRYTRGCASDPNAVTALRRLPGGAIAYTSKLAVDLDGSPYACGPRHGRMDQCPTSLMLPDGRGGEVPVDADAVPYVVIPDAGPGDTAGPAAYAGEFQRKTGIRVGDFGVVIARGRTVPVIVADAGPYSKLGEGSLALHRLLGREQCTKRDDAGVCVAVIDDMASISRNVTTILFPGSARHDLTPADIAAVTRQEGRHLWEVYRHRLGLPAPAEVAPRRKIGHFVRGPHGEHHVAG
jgi:hypothetical protein